MKRHGVRAAVLLAALLMAGCVAPGGSSIRRWEDFETVSADGALVAASLYAAKTERRRVIVLIHQLGGNRASLRDLALGLRDDGFNVLTVDLRGHGESTSRAGSPLLTADLTPEDYQRMQQDVNAAMRAVAGRADIRSPVFGLVGMSLGANVALRAAQGDPLVRVVCALSPGLDYAGINVEDTARNLKKPLLIVTATEDPVSRDASAKLASPLSETRKLLEMPGNEHGLALLTSETGTRVRAEILAWLRAYLNPPSAAAEDRSETPGEGDWKRAYEDLRVRLERIEAREDAARAEREAKEQRAADPRVPVFDRRKTELLVFSDTLRIGGYTDVAFADLSGENATFEARTLGLLLSAQPADRLRFTGEMEILFGGDLGGSDGGLQVDEARVDLELWPALRLSGGVLKVPMGKYNLHAQHPVRDLVSRPLTAQTLVPATWADAGMGLSGEFTREGDDFDYELFFINGFGDEIFDGSGFTDATGRAGRPRDNNKDKAVVGRLAWRPAWADGLELAPSVYYGDYDDRAKRSVTMYGFDGSYHLGGFAVSGEGFVSLLERDPQGRRVPDRMQGFFVEARYATGFAFLDRLLEGFESPRIIGALRIGQVDTNVRSETLGDRRRLSAALSFRPDPAYALKFEYSFDLDRSRIQNIKSDQGLWISLSAMF